MKRNLILLLALACLVATSAAAGTLEVRDSWVREPNPARPIGAAFMTIENPGGESVSIVGATSKAAEVVEIHEMKMSNGVMKMRMLESLEVPARSTVKLEPGGLHLMLIRLTGELKDGDTVEIELSLSNDEVLVVKALVKKAETGH